MFSNLQSDTLTYWVILAFTDRDLFLSSSPARVVYLYGSYAPGRSYFFNNACFCIFSSPGYIFSSLAMLGSVKTSSQNAPGLKAWMKMLQASGYGSYNGPGRAPLMLMVYYFLSAFHIYIH